MNHRILAFLAVGLAAAPAAAGLYVAERLEITLRAGPGTSYRVLKMLTSGTPVERLEEQEGWLRVRGPGDAEGWVVARYVSAEPPMAPRLDAAARELEALRARDAQRQAELDAALASKEQSAQEAGPLRGRVAELERELAEWRRLNQGVVELTARADAAEAGLRARQDEFARLQAQNRGLEAREKFYWFFSGVVVLLLGWALGYVYAASRHRARSAARFRM